MRTCRHALVWLAATSCGQAQSMPGLTAEQDGLFRLLDRFDPLDTAPLQFVRAVTTGSTDGQESGESSQYGFLLQGGEPFRFRALTLDTQSLRREEQMELRLETRWRFRSRFEPKDLREFVAEFVEYLGREPHGSAREERYCGWRSRMSPSTLGVLLARACARRGDLGQVQALWNALPPHRKIRDELAMGLYQWIRQCFVEPERTREDLLRLSRVWLEEFPDQTWQRDMAARITMLERQVVRAQVGPSPRTDPPIDALIDALQDQATRVHERFGRENGSWSLLGRTEPDASPAARIGQLGHAAVPALLAALEDLRLSRCVVRHYGIGGGGFLVLPVGDHACALLQQISGLDFDRTPEDVVRWRKWWRAVAEKGEEAALVEMLSGDAVARDMASMRLLERWPRRLEEVLRAHAPRGARAKLLERIAGFREPAVLPALEQALEEAETVADRVLAARALLDRGRRHAFERFLTAWPEDGEPRSKGFRWLVDADRHAVAKLLLESGDAQAIRVVAASLPFLDPEARIAVLGVLGSKELPQLLARAPAAQRAEVEAMFESMLVALLDDPVRGEEFVSSTWKKPWFAEQAALHLCRHWPERYSFPTVASRRQRKQQIAAIKELHAAARGATTRPASAPAASRPADRNVVREVTFVTYEEDQLTLPPELLATARGVALSPATPENLLGLLLAAARALPSQRGAVSLEADRTGDGTGVMVVIRVRKEAGGDDWGVGYTIHAAGQKLADGYDGGKRTLFDDPDDFREPCAAMARALATSPEQRFVIAIDLRWQ